MSRPVPARASLLAIGAALCAALAACAGTLFTAPPGSSIFMIATPGFVASEGGPAGRSTITVQVTEPLGTPVSDGTVVLFFTDLGRIDERGKTKDGITRVNFVSDSNSGTAHVTAVSGGQAPTTPVASPSPAAGSGIASASGTGNATVEVIVGNARVTAVRLHADPPRITLSNSTHVFATVIDGNGNPVPNVPVYFRVVADISTEFFDSAGRPVYTNNSGVAEDVMRTRRLTQGVASVTAAATGPGRFVEPSNPLAIPIL